MELRAQLHQPRARAGAAQRAAAAHLTTSTPRRHPFIDTHRRHGAGRRGPDADPGVHPPTPRLAGPAAQCLRALTHASRSEVSQPGLQSCLVWWRWSSIEELMMRVFAHDAERVEAGDAPRRGRCTDAPDPDSTMTPHRSPSGSRRWLRSSAPRSRCACRGSSGLCSSETGVVMMADLCGVSNAKAERELAWRSAHSSWRQEFAAA
jgi:hypothetical protein